MPIDKHAIYLNVYIHNYPVDEPAPRVEFGEAGAPETEIEITPEMIEAGVAEFLAYDSDYERPRDAVVEIYLAMTKLIQLPPPDPSGGQTKRRFLRPRKRMG